MIENEDLTPDREEVPGQENEVLNDISSVNIDVQEQQNSENLSQRIEEENKPASDYRDAGETVDKASQGEQDLSSFLQRTVPQTDVSQQKESDRPLTKNLLGDNPPGSEQAAFDAGNAGDMSSAQVTYNAENVVENFRENLDRTESQLELDKKLRENRNEE